MKLSVKSGPRIRKQETVVIAAVSCFFVICKSNKKTVWNQTKAQQVLCKLWKKLFSSFNKVYVYEPECVCTHATVYECA